MPTVDLRIAFGTELPKPTWIIEGMIPAGTILMSTGDPGTGKTVLNLAEGMHVATGRPFLTFPVNQSRVLYFDQENSGIDLLAYLHRIWVGMERPDIEQIIQFFRVESLSVGDKDWHETVLRIAKEWMPSLIYIDTATSALGIQQENDNSEAYDAVGKLRLIIRETPTHPAIKVLKHSKYVSGGGHGGGTRRTIRGAKGWVGAVDQTMFHIKEHTGRPRKDGLHTTIIVPEKTRAFGLTHHVRVIPSYVDAETKGLILKGEKFSPEKDYLIVVEN